jgi:hypothetical protein
MGRDEQDILEFLKQFDTFVSRKEITKRVGGKSRFRKNPAWARPILDRLVVEGLIEANEHDHYRLKDASQRKERPQNKKSSYSFGEKIYDLDDDQPFAAITEAIRNPKNR